MTLQQAQTDVRRHHTPPDYTPRLRLKPKAPPTGYVDGAWWPRSDDLTRELPDLLAVLSVWLGAIQRVIYSLNGWAKAPAILETGGRLVRLDGFPPAKNTLEVLGVNRHKIVLLVVPPHTNPDDAHDYMMTAAGPNNTSTVDGLLTISARDRETRTQTAAREERWNSEGRAQG